MKQWVLNYDAVLDQYYYLNTKDNTVAFDSPCEVSKRSRFFGLNPCRKIKSSASIASTSSAASFLTRLSLRRKSRPDTAHDVVLDDEYYISNPTNFKNFAGTSLTPPDFADTSSVDSSDSIVTYYSNLSPHDYQIEPVASSENAHTFNKEKERMELRLQFLREMEV